MCLLLPACFFGWDVYFNPPKENLNTNPLQLCCDGRRETFEDVGFVFFSIFNIVWATLYLQAWKRYSNELAFRWGTLDQRDDLLAEPRPLFNGPLETSPVTGRLEPHYPVWKRYVFRYCITVPAIALCLCCVFAVMIASLQIQDWWDLQLRLRGFPVWLGYVPKVMLAVVISLMDEAYFKIAVWLNDKGIQIARNVTFKFLSRNWIYYR